MDVPFCVLSDTGPPSPSLCSPIMMQTTQGLCVIPSNRQINLSSELSVFSSDFLKTRVYGFYCYCIPKCFWQKDHHLIWEQIVLMLKWVFVSGQEGKKITLMLSSFPYQSSLKLQWVEIQHFPVTAFKWKPSPSDISALNLLQTLKTS